MDELGEPGVAADAGVVVCSLSHPILIVPGAARFAKSVCSDCFFSSRFLPLIPAFTDPAPFNKAAVEAGKAASLRLLETLEGVLRARRYLVGDGVTLADIMVAVFVSRGLEWVLDARWRSGHEAIMRHFEMVKGLEYVSAVIEEFVLVATETPIEDPKGGN